ncbi:MAG TPA: RNA polymerase sigma factor [Longimicrobium sp.]
MEIEPIYREHSAVLFRYVVRMTGDAELAADVVQDTFIKLSEMPPRSPDPRNWLYRVATNLVRERRRTAVRRLRLAHGGTERLPHGDAPVPPDVLLERQEARDAVRAALAALPERDRAALLMRADGMAYDEIAKAIGATPGSVGTILVRAMRKLTRELPMEGEGHR